MVEGKLIKQTQMDLAGSLWQSQAPATHSSCDDTDGHTGAKPIELALLALGECEAFEVIDILRKKRQKVTHYEVALHAEQNHELPTYFTHVEIMHRLRGDTDLEAVERALYLSETKCCAVGAVISKTAKIENKFEIIEERVAEPTPVLAEAGS
jgi:putative redox protein